jgi:hypothetical protein
MHKNIRWSKTLMIGTHQSYSYLGIVMIRLITAMDSCFPTIHRQDLTSHCLNNLAKASNTCYSKKLAGIRGGLINA